MTEANTNVGELMDRQYSPLNLHRLRCRPAAWLKLPRMVATRDFALAACFAIVVVVGGLERWTSEQRFVRGRDELTKLTSEAHGQRNQIADLNVQVRDLHQAIALLDARNCEDTAKIEAQMAEIAALRAKLIRTVSQRSTSRER